MTQYLAILSIYYAGMAHVNAGIITIIWRAAVFTTAVADWLWFGQKLKYYHHIGLLAIVICVGLISWAKIEKGSEKINVQVKIAPVWIPLMFAVLATIFMTFNTMQVKHLTQPRIGFNAT